MLFLHGKLELALGRSQVRVRARKQVLIARVIDATDFLREIARLQRYWRQAGFSRRISEMGSNYTCYLCLSRTAVVRLTLRQGWFARLLPIKVTVLKGYREWLRLVFEHYIVAPSA